jgi:hypothetical protein
MEAAATLEEKIMEGAAPFEETMKMGAAVRFAVRACLR